jgi:hypothetical protein
MCGTASLKLYLTSILSLAILYLSPIEKGFAVFQRGQLNLVVILVALVVLAITGT